MVGRSSWVYQYVPGTESYTPLETPGRPSAWRSRFVYFETSIEGLGGDARRSVGSGVLPGCPVECWRLRPFLTSPGRPATAALSLAALGLVVCALLALSSSPAAPAAVGQRGASPGSAGQAAPLELAASSGGDAAQGQQQEGVATLAGKWHVPLRRAETAASPKRSSSGHSSAGVAASTTATTTTSSIAAGVSTSSMTLTSSSTARELTVVTPRHSEDAEPSLYCFALARPEIGEIDLMATQLRHNIGVFACDEFTVFSSKAVDLDEEGLVKAEVIEGSLVAPIGGLYMMALNSEIFVRVWRQVFKSRRHERNDWVVKVDPDAVFLPARLREHCSSLPALQGARKSKGVFLNNCRIGNHGPIEVISSAGVTTFSKGIDQCLEEKYAPFTDVGEDVFVRRCLRNLGVQQLDDFQLLSEINCFENPSPCTADKVTFHPFKTKVAFLQCLSQATGETTTVAPPAAPLAHSCLALGCGHSFVKEWPCQCNDACGRFQNCCPDYEAICPKVVEEPKCEQLGCSSFKPGRVCQCDDTCKHFGNCCADFSAACRPAG